MDNKFEKALESIKRTAASYVRMREELELAQKEKELFYMHMKNEDLRKKNKILSLNEYKEYKKTRKR